MIGSKSHEDDHRIPSLKFSHAIEMRDASEVEVRSNDQIDWVIFDLESGPTFERVVQTFGVEQRIRGQSFSRSFKFIIKSSSISQISPSSLGQVQLVHQRPDLVGLRGEFEGWLKNVIRLQPFIRRFEDQATELFEKILKPMLEKVARLQENRSVLIYPATSKQLLMNFLNLFEILLNELYKHQIISGLISLDQFQKCLTEANSNLETIRASEIPPRHY